MELIAIYCTTVRQKETKDAYNFIVTSNHVYENLFASEKHMTLLF